MTKHEEQVLDQKIEELNRKIAVYERLRGEVEALGRRGNKEQAFFAGRRSMAMELKESGGLSSARLGQEILFLLPDDFVQFYGSLFHRALRVNDSSVMHGRSGGVEKSKGSTGTVLGSDTRLQSSGTGKKYKNTTMAVASEKALRIKEGLDKGLAELTQRAKLALEDRESYAGLEQTLNGRVRPPGGGQCTGKSCRSFLKMGWKFCPMCGTRTDGLPHVRDQGRSMEGTGTVTGNTGI